MVFGRWTELELDGKTGSVDCTGKLHHFLNCQAFSADFRFSTDDPGYGTLLAVYYKESDRPDFSIELHKGIVTVYTRHGGQGRVLSGGPACCDGRSHDLSLRGNRAGLSAWLDGERIFHDPQLVPYCEYGYVGFATIGRGTLRDQFGGYFKGRIERVELSDEDLPVPLGCPAPGPRPVPLFAKGMANCENYRIPTLVSAGDVTVASADARMEAPGDNPNHILRAVRISRDSGETWSPIHTFCDFGGVGREDGAAAIDGSLLYDEQTGILWMLYSHTSAGIGSAASVPGTGFDNLIRKRLMGRDGEDYFLSDGQVVAADGSPTGFTCDAFGRLFQNGREAGSICHGAERPFRQADTSFLHLIHSTDGGETWSEPVELNPQVKAPWMTFLGAGPGRGLQLTGGRLVYPIYFGTGEGTSHSSAVIYSDDHGKTWRRGESVNDGRPWEGGVLEARTLSEPRAFLGECQVTELPGGELKIFLRNGLGKYVCTSVSRDGGETWGDVSQELALPDPGCQCGVLRVPYEGGYAYLFSNPADPVCRVRGTVRFSRDGVDWKTKKLLEPGEFGYSCMTVLPDGQIGILYEGKDLTQQFMKFPLEWLLRGDAP